MKRINIKKINHCSKEAGYYTPNNYTKIYTNKRSAHLAAQREAKKLTQILRQIHEIFLNVQNISGKYLFDLRLCEANTYYEFVNTLNERIYFITYRYGGQNPEFYSKTLKYLLHKLYDFIIFSEKNFAKIKYTGNEHQLKINRYAIDVLRYDLQKLSADDNSAESMKYYDNIYSNSIKIA
ncbi:MAG: hypothetical protein NW207_04725 [Cytophagales bacterium]|nr:hypothetical protein [Cytophagales bacterium]